MRMPDFLDRREHNIRKQEIEERRVRPVLAKYYSNSIREVSDSNIRVFG